MSTLRLLGGGTDEPKPYSVPGVCRGTGNDGVAEADALTLAAVSLRDWLTDPHRWARLIADLALDGRVDEDGARHMLAEMLSACHAALT